jgi:molybdenum cofactor guanylyltransferase
VSRPLAILLAGPVFSGKSRFAERLVARLRADGRVVAGFVQRGAFDPGGRKIGYDLVGLASGAIRPLAQRSDTGDGWRFDETAFGAALGEIRDGADLIVIDEVGHLELAGRGHATAVDRALASSPVTLIVVREALADRALEWLSPRADVSVIRLEPGREEEIITIIRAALLRTDAAR